MNKEMEIKKENNNNTKTAINDDLDIEEQNHLFAEKYEINPKYIVAYHLLFNKNRFIEIDASYNQEQITEDIPITFSVKNELDTILIFNECFDRVSEPIKQNTIVVE